jgi:Flp pilus assembly protein TadD
MGLVIEGSRVPEPGTLLVHADSAVGETRSAVFSPSLDRVVALAMLRREVSDPGTVVHVRLDSGLVASTVRELPLYRPPGPKDQAESFYGEGIKAFKQDRFEEALSLFERATLMDPHRYDAFESAGICYERLDRIDEAESTMQSLTEMDPENVMAWTNLSRYRAQKGMIEEAEKIKGHVTFLVWKKEVGDKTAARKAEEEESSLRARLEDRIVLFQQVLALDDADVVANFGLGKVYLDLDRFEEALPHFTKAIENQKHYSMAYNHLGTCLANLGRLDEASEVLRKGIAAATKKGDLMPKRDMVRKLEEIETSLS